MNFIKIKGDIAIVILMFLIISMLLVPLPQYLLDMLIALNITLALMLFLSSIFMKDVLSLSTFPAILLITALFRLSLSISTTRAILVDGYAGDIIETFGDFVIAGNIVVGIIVFSIITIVQFIVITKGSERVAEVSARFSLDGLPGKQMSIDADVRAGNITAEEAFTKRSILGKETHLFGSMDGALKFVKGDAIAGIIIILVNIIGGIAMGMINYNMSFAAASEKYTILTIGDGLVAQIPALLIAISAGFIVTKADSQNDNLGQDIFSQIVSDKKVYIYISIFTFLLCFIPGMPVVIFSIFSVLSMTMFLFLNKKDNQSLKMNDNFDDVDFTVDDNAISTDVFDVDNALPEMVVIMLLMDISHKNRLLDLDFHNKFKLHFFYQNGLTLPKIHYKFIELSDKNIVHLYVNEVEVSKVTYLPEFSRVVTGSNLDSLNDSLTKIYNNGEDEVWCENSNKETLLNLGLVKHLISAEEHVYISLSSDLLKNVKEYFGIQEVKNLIDKVEAHYPELTKEVYRAAPIPRLTEILQRLIIENISIRNIKVVLETVAQLGQKEKDNLLLCEYIRGSLSRYISDKYSVDNIINVILITPQLEELVQSSIKQTNSGPKLLLSHEQKQMIFEKLDVVLEQTTHVSSDVVLLSSADIRRYIKSAIGSRYPRLEVLSVDEIYESIKLNTIGVV
ncbi:MAG: type III secretion system export apparatus subunit SctV [Vibrio sp.]|uniref:type III secretion system export apparatus subunit SctV n=1 Tax=Vibrio TaxID=662 RepID=UPI00140D4098|nr:MULTISPECIES: type III secretion system export apparatus subunit SctV [unclassified Vibrio]QIL85663.1 type III secretion system export apparatus subunit SctV [Vibrio sp. HDW18]